MLGVTDQGRLSLGALFSQDLLTLLNASSALSLVLLLP